MHTFLSEVGLFLSLYYHYAICFITCQQTQSPCTYTKPSGNTVLASDDKSMEKQPRVSPRHIGMEITVLAATKSREQLRVSTSLGRDTRVHGQKHHCHGQPLDAHFIASGTWRTNFFYIKGVIFFFFP